MEWSNETEYKGLTTVSTDITNTLRL